MATKQALADEKKRNVKQYIFVLRKIKDSDIIEKLESQENKNGYLKSLVRADIENNNRVELKEGFTLREKKLICDYLVDLIKKDIAQQQEREEEQ